MLNRRTLRTKIMQSLFSFEQCKEANYQLALNQLEDFFQPDLNSMEVQNKELLKSQRKLAKNTIEKYFHSGTTPTTADESVNKAVADAITVYNNRVAKDFSFFKKNMISEVERLNDYYRSVLNLLIQFADLAAEEKKLNFSNFIQLPWIKAFRDHAELFGKTSKGTVTWNGKSDQVKNWFTSILKPNEEFQKFCQLASPSFEDQQTIMKHVVRKLIIGKTDINDYFEQEDIRWAEDKDIIKSLVDKTLKSLTEENRSVQLEKISLDWEDDKLFMEKLFEKAVEIESVHKELIANNTKNWEVERLPLTDRITLEMAISELIHFPNIPVKVSINEYIEMSKHYSTPKSSQFINGILDVIAKELIAAGVVKKSGRGLIDNK
jgi:transcription antitermination protein NusB